MIAAAAPFDDLPAASSIVPAARKRAAALVKAAGAADEIDAALVLAADQFAITTAGRPTAVAGYPWFGEWSRDLMTSYEGLYLSTNRAAEGREVLRTSAATVSEGMLANTADTGSLEYNTVDGTLWFVHALDRHIAVTGDDDLGAELAPVIEQIVDHHLEGTRFGIGVDPADGLLRQGADGWALTWMDARIDGVPVTPRAGKPVEVNALVGAGAPRSPRGSRARAPPQIASRISPIARRPRSSRASCGLTAPASSTSSTGPPAMTPRSARTSCSRSRCPMRLLAGDADAARAAVDACRRSLLTPLGLRSLSPDDPAYRPYHRGNPAERDSRLPPGDGLALADRPLRRRRQSRRRPGRRRPRRPRGASRRLGRRLGLRDRRRCGSARGDRLPVPGLVGGGGAARSPQPCEEDAPKKKPPARARA